MYVRFITAALAGALLFAGCASQTEPPASDADSKPVTSAPTASSTNTAPTPEPITATDHAAGNYPEELAILVPPAVDGVSVTFREIRIQPGAGTGEHCHAGNLIGVVSEGELTHYAGIYPQGVHVYHAGDAIVEGSGYRHEGRNEGATDVVLWVAYLIPDGEPLAQTDLDLCDPEPAPAPLQPANP